MVSCSFSTVLRPSGLHRTVLFLVLGAITGAGCTSTPEKANDPTTERQAIRQVLQAQVDAWNAGDIERFMQGYTQTDSLRFASGGQVRRGWDTTLARYRKSYPDRAAMGTLAFSQIDIQLLAPGWALVFGGWQLERADGTPNGLFTLLFRKTEDGAWRIVHDHTSSAAG